jgi:hypothetical protein
MICVSCSVAVHGTLRCLALLAGDIDESQLGQVNLCLPLFSRQQMQCLLTVADLQLQVVPALLPQLLNMCQDVSCPAHMQHKALVIVHQLLVQLGYLQVCMLLRIAK